MRSPAPQRGTPARSRGRSLPAGSGGLGGARYPRHRRGTRSPRRRASGCARPGPCRCSAPRRLPGSPGAPVRPRDTSACTRPAAARSGYGTPPQPLLAWLRATGQRLPRGRTVLDDETEMRAYCHPLRGVNAAAGARDQLRLGAGAPLPTAGLKRWDAGLALLPHLWRASPRVGAAAGELARQDALDAEGARDRVLDERRRARHRRSPSPNQPRRYCVT